MADLVYRAPPVLARFMKSEAFGRIALGPVGSGKTVSCVIELLRRATQQAPAPDGYRYTRFAIVRQTLKQLKDTVLKDCEQWLQGLGVWKVSENTFHLLFDDVRSEWPFIPLEDANDQARLLSMQLTGAWLSECIEMNIDILGPVSGRLFRYPSGPRGAPTWGGIIADTNFPTEMTAWHTFLENLPPDWQRFMQPSGLEQPVFNKQHVQISGAENLNHLAQTAETMKLPLNHPVRIAQGRKYYERFINMYGADSDWVKRYVYAQYGDDPSGQGVFRASYKSDFHTREDTMLIPGYPLIIGQDFGRNPWSVICQPDHLGRLVIHEEVPAFNIGLEKHVQEHLRPRLLSDRYLGFRVAIVGDPAGVAKDTISEETSFDALKRLGLPTFPAPTNDVDARLRAVEALLGRQVNGGPALVINRTRAPFLCRAMSGGYRFATSKQGVLKPKPDKENAGEWEGQKVAYSHVADALQYAALVVHGNMIDYISRMLAPRKANTGPRVSPKGWT